MKFITYLIAVTALVFSTLVQAQEQPTQCSPTSVSEVRYGRVGTDFYAYWFCKGEFQNSFVWRTFLGNEMKPEMLDQLAAYVQGKNPKLVESPVQYGPSDPKIAHLKAAVFEAVRNDKARPAEPTWQVAKNGTSATRPAYYVDATGDTRKLANTTPQRATVGAECHCRADNVLRVGTNIYCPVVNAGYALCTKKP